MRFYTVLAQRPAYYDRNPLAVINAGNVGGVGPHSAATRWTYTVPTARKCNIEGVELGQVRVTVAAPVALSQVYINYTPSGGAATKLGLVWAEHNTAGQASGPIFDTFGIMTAGDALSGIDSDSSTGGTIDFIDTMKGTEFDA